MLYFTGDTHSKILDRFSFTNEPNLRQLTNDDIMLILGDCGIPWFNPHLNFYTHDLKPGSEKQELYTLKWMASQKYHWLLLAGNHENYDLIQQMPYIYKYGAKLRIMTYENFYSYKILIIDKPSILYINNKKILAIPGAESHDYDYILEPVKETKNMIATIEKNNRMYYNSVSYRIKHFSWWPEEVVDADAAYQIIKDDFNFDYVISHDVPAAVLERWKPYWAPARLQPTYSEQVLEGIRININYDLWLHGHYHNYINLPSIKTLGLYKQILSMDEINIIKNNNCI